MSAMYTFGGHNTYRHFDSDAPYYITIDPEGNHRMWCRSAPQRLTGSQTEGHGDRAFLWAALLNDTRAVQWYLSVGGNIHVREDEALISASFYGDVDMVRLLLDNGADIHARREEAIKSAVRSALFIGTPEDKKVNPRNESFDLNGALEKRKETIKLLLDRGADVHAVALKDNERGIETILSQYRI